MDKVELTLDNFEQFYRPYVFHKKVNGDWLRNTPQHFVDDVRSNLFRFKGAVIFTRIKKLKYSISLYEKADQIIEEELLK